MFVTVDSRWPSMTNLSLFGGYSTGQHLETWGRLAWLRLQWWGWSLGIVALMAERELTESFLMSIAKDILCSMLCWDYHVMRWGPELCKQWYRSLLKVSHHKLEMWVPREHEAVLLSKSSSYCRSYKSLGHAPVAVSVIKASRPGQTISIVAVHQDISDEHFQHLRSSCYAS